MLARLRRLQGWQRTLAIIFVAQLFSAMGFSIVFPFLPLYVADLDTTFNLNPELAAGLVIAAQAFTMMIAGPIWGALADRYGRKMMLARATFGGSIILGLMGFVVSAEQLILLRAIQGMVTGTVSAANALVAAEAPRERTGYAMGIVQVGQWSGVALGPLLGGILADAFGYRMPFVLTGALLLGAGVLVWFGVQENFNPSTRIIEQNVSFFAEWREVVALPGVAATYSTRFFSSLGRTMISPITPLFVAALLSESNVVSTTTGLVTGVASATGTLGAVFLGRLGDRIGHRKVLIWSAIGAGACFLPQSLVTNVWQLLGLQALFGIASGGLVAAPSALLAQYTPPGEEGAVYGLDNSVVAFGRTLAPMIGSGIAVGLGNALAPSMGADLANLTALRGPFAVAGLIYLVMGTLAALTLPRTRRTWADRQAAMQEAPTASD